ncbi:MAG: hypothetical protein ACE5GW_08240 [Planctomycetota bacterium]
MSPIGPISPGKARAATIHLVLSSALVVALAVPAVLVLPEISRLHDRLTGTVADLALLHDRAAELNSTLLESQKAAYELRRAIVHSNLSIQAAQREHGTLKEQLAMLQDQMHALLALLREQESMDPYTEETRNDQQSGEADAADPELAPPYPILTLADIPPEEQQFLRPYPILVRSHDGYWGQVTIDSPVGHPVEAKDLDTAHLLAAAYGELRYWDQLLTKILLDHGRYEWFPDRQSANRYKREYDASYRLEHTTKDGRPRQHSGWITKRHEGGIAVLDCEEMDEDPERGRLLALVHELGMKLLHDGYGSFGVSWHIPD